MQPYMMPSAPSAYPIAPPSPIPSLSTLDECQLENLVLLLYARFAPHRLYTQDGALDMNVHEIISLFRGRYDELLSGLRLKYEVSELEFIQLVLDSQQPGSSVYVHGNHHHSNSVVSTIPPPSRVEPVGPSQSAFEIRHTVVQPAAANASANDGGGCVGCFFRNLAGFLVCLVCTCILLGLLFFLLRPDIHGMM